MKKFLLALAFFAGPVFAVEKSTDTVEVPVEFKVVELKIVPTENPFIINGSTKKRGRKVQPLPLDNRATCSGAFINDSGDILTARHCVEIGTNIEVITHDQKRYAATIIATSTVHDLALIHIDRRNTAFFTLADGVKRGETITILGSPLAITDVQSVGTVARIDGDILFVDCSALPGNSGGPVFNAEKKLVGILVAGHIVRFGVTHLNIAQGLDTVAFFLHSAKSKLSDFSK